MNLKDYIGKRGENLFRVIITEFCDGRPWFDEIFLGEKHPTSDFMVELIESTPRSAFFFVQVKATTSRYTGKGSRQKLNVRVSRSDVEKLGGMFCPSYVVGIDVENARGYLLGPLQGQSRAITGIPTANLLECPSLKELWRDVSQFWNDRNREEIKS